MTRLELHRRQFLVNGGDRGPAGWRTFSLEDALWLHAHPDLPVRSVRDRDGSSWTLLGWPVPARDATGIVESLQATPGREVWRLSDGWAGRWVLVGRGRLGLDAAGMLGVLFNPQQRTAGSSPALIPSRGPTYAIRHSDRMNWYPGPGSGRLALRRLLPSQQLDLSRWTPVSRPLLSPVPARTYEATLDELQTVLTRTVQGMAALGEVMVPLSAGHDSRLILGLLWAAGTRPPTFTMDRRPEMSRADRSLPERIARRLGVPHRWIPRPAAYVHPEAIDLYREQSAGHAIEQDRLYLAHGQLDQVTDGHVLLTGGAFEIARRHYRRLPAHDGLRALGAFAPLPPQARQSLREYFAWTDAHPEPIDWRDRFYWEQRIGAWHSAGAQAMDMAPGLRLSPANCRHTLSLLLGIPEARRIVSGHHVDLVARLAPALADLPFNPKDPPWARLAQLPRRVRRWSRRWKAPSSD